MTARHAPVTLGVVVRAAPRGPGSLVAGATVAAVATAAAFVSHGGAVLVLQASTVALTGAAVTLLDEPRSLVVLPTSLAWRRGLALAAGLPLLALLWAALLGLGGVDGAEARALTLQLTAVTALTLGLTAWGGDPARALAGVALAFGTGRVLFGAQLFPAGTEAARWSGATGWWAAAAGLGFVLLAAFSRD